MTSPPKPISSDLYAPHIRSNLPLSSNRKYSRFWTTASLIFADVFAFIISGLLAVVGRAAVGLDWEPELFPQIFYLVIPCIIIYQIDGLYPTITMESIEELKRLTTTTTTVMLGVTGLTFYIRNADEFSRLLIAFTWLFSLVLVPVGRSIMRTIASRFQFWRKPAVIIGSGNQSIRMIDYLRNNPEIGLDPVLVLDGFGEPVDPEYQIPVLSAKLALNNMSFSKNIKVNTAILISSDVPEEIIGLVSKRQIGGFQHLILIPKLDDFKTIGISTVEIGGVVGLRAKYNLYNPWQSAFKRILDFVFGAIGIILSAPIFLLIAALVKLDSRGSVFYAHTRIGKNEEKFKMWKFRTMVADADKVLKESLDADPVLCSEWEQNQKLKDDPRITKVGDFLRRYSLDELPQLWNVLRGDMSLVGPRPIVDAEVVKYADSFEFYTRVKPGITGLWQISGRNNTQYNDRISLDEYYVRNWSVWMDIYILARTPLAVFRREGAY